MFPKDVPRHVAPDSFERRVEIRLVFPSFFFFLVDRLRGLEKEPRGHVKCDRVFVAFAKISVEKALKRPGEAIFGVNPERMAGRGEEAREHDLIILG